MVSAGALILGCAGMVSGCAAEPSDDAAATETQSAVGVGKALVNFLRGAKHPSSNANMLMAFGRQLDNDLDGMESAAQGKTLRALFGADLPDDMSPSTFGKTVSNGADQSTYMLRLTPEQVSASAHGLRAVQAATAPGTERLLFTLAESVDQIRRDLVAAELPEAQIYDVFTAVAWMRTGETAGDVAERITTLNTLKHSGPQLSQPAASRVRDTAIDAMQGARGDAPRIEQASQSAGGAIVAAANMAERVSIQVDGGKVTGSLLRRAPLEGPRMAAPTEPTNLEEAASIASGVKQGFDDSLAAMNRYGQTALGKMTFVQQQKARIDRTVAVLSKLRADANVAPALKDPAEFEKYLATHWDELWANEALNAP